MNSIAFKSIDPKQYPSLGRNGNMQTIGIVIEDWDKDRIAIVPVNTKGVSETCFISMPKSEIDNLIKALKKAR